MPQPAAPGRQFWAARQLVTGRLHRQPVTPHRWPAHCAVSIRWFSTPTTAWLSLSAGQCPATANGRKAWELSGAKAVIGKNIVIADGGYRSTGLVIPYRRWPGQADLRAWKEERNPSHRKVRARVEHAFARMRGWKTLRDCRLKGRRRAFRHARHCPPAQPQPRRMTRNPGGEPARLRSFGSNQRDINRHKGMIVHAVSVDHNPGVRAESCPRYR